MNKIAAIALAAALAFSAPAAVFAQETLTSVTLETSIGGDGFNDALAALDTAETVSVVKLSTVGDVTKEGFAATLAAKADYIKSLQTRVEGNEVAKKAVADAGSSVDKVVAITATGSMGVTLYVDDLK